MAVEEFRLHRMAQRWAKLAYGYTLGHYEAYGTREVLFGAGWQCPYGICRRNREGFDPNVFIHAFQDLCRSFVVSHKARLNH